MGAKTTPDRNERDSVIIEEPLGSFGGGKSRQDRIAQTCEISFHVKVKEGPLVKKGVPVSLQKAGPYYHILVLASIVGKLSIKQSEMVDACALLNVSYSGTIVKESKGMYAHFRRIIR